LHINNVLKNLWFVFFHDVLYSVAGLKSLYPDPDSDPGFSKTRKLEKLTEMQGFFLNIAAKLSSKAFMMDFQVLRDTLQPFIEISLKHEILHYFLSS
jgi:hypothetical protein